MVEYYNVKLTSSHKYVKSTITCGMILQEYLLNTDKRSQTSKRARKSSYNWVGQNKKGRKRGKTGM